MKRFVIEVPDDMVRDAHPQTGASVISGPGTALVQNGMHGWLGFIPDAYVVDAETIPDPLPLPTEPGARFWGKSNACEPCWWFVQETHTPQDYVYVPARGGFAYPEGCVHMDNAEMFSLVRLPDPAATS